MYNCAFVHMELHLSALSTVLSRYFYMLTLYCLSQTGLKILLSANLNTLP